MAAEMHARRPEMLAEMTFEQKRKLVQTAFAGKDLDGHRFGVYVMKDEAGRWRYEIRGIVPTEHWTVPTLAGSLPMRKHEAQDILGIEEEYSDFNPLEETAGEEITRFNCHYRAAAPP